MTVEVIGKEQPKDDLMEQLVRSWRHEIYFGLDNVQEGAKPHIELNQDQNRVEVSDLYANVGNTKETPFQQAQNVANDVALIVRGSHGFSQYTVVVKIKDREGNPHTFNI